MNELETMLHCLECGGTIPLRDQWRKNFADYMQPHAPKSFEGKLLLDVGTGSGRHAFHAAEAGARVVAFEPGAFDFVMSIGVLPVNGEFDRFSAPLERRYTRAEAEAMFARAGLENASVLPNHGWVGDGRVPLRD
jgi:SAM-dependent methyltransferase